MNILYPFIYIVLATVFFIAATILGGSLVAESTNTFNWMVLRESLIKYAVILIMAFLIYCGGFFGDEILSNHTTEYINLKNLVTLGLSVYAVNRAADATKHWIAITQIKMKDED